MKSMCSQMWPSNWPWKWPWIIKIKSETYCRVKITYKWRITIVPTCIWEYHFFRNFGSQIGLLTLKMTLNHQNNIRNELFSENYTKTRYHNLLYLLKNHIFTHSSFKLSFDLQNALESSKEYKKKSEQYHIKITYYTCSYLHLQNILICIY